MEACGSLSLSLLDDDGRGLVPSFTMGKMARDLCQDTEGTQKEPKVVGYNGELS